MNYTHNNKWTVETDMPSWDGFDAYMLRNIRMEKELWSRQQFLNKGKGVRKINRYFNSTPVKRMASRFYVEAALDVNLHYTSTKIATLMDVSRVSICKITNECIEAGWVEEYQLKNVRYVKATTYHVDIHRQYLETLTDLRNQYVTDFGAAYKLFKAV